MLLLLACQSEPEKSLPLDTGSMWSDMEMPAPMWDSAGVEVTITQALSWGIPTAKDVVSVYQSLIISNDPTCPTLYGTDLDALIGCTANNGWIYNGVGSYTPNETGYGMMTDITIISPEGAVFSGGGVLGYQGTPNMDAMYVLGTWGWDNGSGWIAQKPSSEIYFQHYRTDEGEKILLNGGLSIAGATLSFEDLQFTEACQGQPQGTLGIREPTGYWYTLTFSDTCDGCGALMWGDQSLGTACAPLKEAVGALLAGGMG